MKRIAIIVSKFNSEITNGLLEGAKNLFAERSIAPEQVDTFWAPGAFELPLLAKTALQTGRYSGVVCLGAVIKGETAHFEHISHASAQGLLSTSLEHEAPVCFGVLTTYDEAQAKNRSQRNNENKGREAAAACLDAIESVAAIKRFSAY